jgi:dTDP-glucose pyrophosphorylase
MSKIKKVLIGEKKNITDAMEKLNQTGIRCLFVFDKNKKFKGTVTDGDLRRYILKTKNFQTTLDKVCNKNSFYVFQNKVLKNKKLKSFLEKNNDLLVPILNKKKEPIDFLDSFSEEKINVKKNLVLVMAGGKGTRMRPFTYILPKALMPVKKKPVILNIFDSFKRFGFDHFLISVRKDEKVLTSYLDQFKEKYRIDYLKESKPLGSGGCLKLINNQKDPFFMINCDSLIKIDPIKLLNFHKMRNSVLTIVTCFKSHQIPYGECETNLKGYLTSIKEKPNEKILTNIGMYVVDPQIKNFFPKKDFFNMDTLIKNLLLKKKKIAIFPIEENNWQDTGNLKDYFSTIKNISQ